MVGKWDKKKAELEFMCAYSIIYIYNLRHTFMHAAHYTNMYIFMYNSFSINHKYSMVAHTHKN